MMMRFLRLVLPSRLLSLNRFLGFHRFSTSHSHIIKKNNNNKNRSFSPRYFSTHSSLEQLKTPKLTEQQQLVLKDVSKGKSVFITGSGGTGKTFLLKQVVNLLKQQVHKPDEVFVTASTGVAACALNGQTLHSFAGIGLGEDDEEELLSRVCKNKLAFQRWKKVKALVIDEISMISGELFDKLEYIAEMCRPKKRGKTWGGIQLIVSGDFFQLPPIIRNGNDDIKEFAFEAGCWNDSFDLQLELTRVFRQSDSQFIELLQGIRKGHRDANKLKLLDKCCLNGLVNVPSDVPRLFPRNDDVKRLNNERLKNLGKEIVSYKAVDKGVNPWRNQLQQGIAPDVLEICLGARVMLIKNKDVEAGLVNGAVGTVIGFDRDYASKVLRKMCAECLRPKVRFDSGVEMVIEPDTWEVMEGNEVQAQRGQIPLILAWAVSIHKCQGMTLDRMQTDLSRAFGCGMVYVALSRVRSLDGLYISGFSSSKIKAHPKVLQFYEGQVGS
ncbi:hypothetical protein MKW94_016505 [Papaver nudicaule]|uniref:ATP-dependent DNA helicase n=1 Tax=Papaver nudicaule TaxID=74823 RepID=A0AA42ASG3_PAPNU|nr:hypothetical protein [Papaver nudicaule]